MAVGDRRHEPVLEWYDAAQSIAKVFGAEKFADADSEAAADDSEIPEFVDAFPSAMPILYLRARVGATTLNNTAGDNPVITNGQNANRPGQYDLSQIIGYTGTSIGVGKEKSVGTAQKQGWNP